MAVGTRTPLAISLLPYQWRAWWRKLQQRGAWAGANTATAIMISLVGAAAAAAGALFALVSLKQGALDRAQVSLEFSLNLVLMGWLALPILVGSTSAEGRGVQPVRLGQYPLRRRQLVAIGLMGRLVQPVYWILTAAWLVTLLPLAFSPRPGIGLISGLFFGVICAWLAWSVELFGGALFSSRRGREILMLVVLLLFVPMLALLWGDYDLRDDSLYYSLFDHEWLLLNMDGTEGLLLIGRFFSPALWVGGSAFGQGLPGVGLLALVAAASIWLALKSLRRVMLHPPAGLAGGRGATKAISTLPGLPPGLGPLVVKELRYLTRTLDHLMGMGMGVIALAWILVKPDHAHLVLPLGAANIVFNESAIPLNNFGLDGPGADRYRLLPLRNREVLLTKNLAYVALVGIHLLPLVVAGLLGGQGWLTLAVVLATFAMALLTAAGGNAVSIRSPAPRAFFNFDSKEQTGGGLALLAAAAIWTVPGLLMVGLWGLGLPIVSAAMAILLVVCVFIYRAALPGAARMFQERAETMRARLTRE